MILFLSGNRRKQRGSGGEKSPNTGACRGQFLRDHVRTERVEGQRDQRVDHGEADPDQRGQEDH